MRNPTHESQSSVAPASDHQNWERETLVQLATAGLNEQRRARRWGIFFKLLGFGYLFFLLLVFGALKLGWDEPGPVGKHTALVDLEGIIAADASASAENVIAGLRAAFANKETAGVILRINSPGGSPVQAGYINDEMQRLRRKYPDIPLYAVISDVCASGGLYAAVAAEKVYADQASVVGSIGVRLDSFGFVEAMDKLGIERRLYAAGEHKGLLDPFLPQNPAERAHIESLLNEIHQQFIDVVRLGRGKRLANTPVLFSGLVWSGARAAELGLIDALGSAGFVAREVIRAEQIIDYTRREDYLQWLAERLGGALAREVEANLFSPALR